MIKKFFDGKIEDCDGVTLVYIHAGYVPY